MAQPDVPPPHLHDSGAGPAVLLLHAFPQEASMWDQQVAALSARYRCLRPDAPGCGSSPAGPAGLRMETWATAVLAALDSAGVDTAALCGISMGGYLALALLRRAPERWSRLALVATRAGTDTEAAREDRLRMAERLRRHGEAAREEIVEPMVERLLSPAARAEFHVSDPVRGRIRRCSPEGLAACQEAMANRPDSTSLLATIGVPATVIAAGDDAVVPASEMEDMAGRIPGARFSVVGGAGHLCPLERPQEVSGLLEEWLAVAAAG